MADESAFNPRQHLILLERKKRDPKTGAWETLYSEYLEVKYRLVWLRDQHPAATVETSLLELDKENRFALFRAQIEIPEIGAVAIAHGSETGADFGDYIEKAETKAVGRALAILGYGTQFTAESEMDDGVRQERPVDAPVDVPNPTPIAEARRALKEKIQQIGMAQEDVRALAMEVVGKSDSRKMSLEELQAIINALDERKKGDIDA